MSEIHTFSHDAFAWKLAECLLEDFAPFVSEPFYNEVKALIGLRDIKGYRKLSVDPRGDLKPYELKARMQIASLFKKYRFSPDALSPEEVYENSVKKFMDNQKRLKDLRIDWTEPLLADVVSRTKGHIGLILGDFSKFDILEKATFGKKSSVGVPMHKACEGQRLEPPISGSSAHIDWFQKLYSSWNRPAYSYAESLAASRKTPLAVAIDTLEAVLVEKTWKDLRMIVPNTTLGTLYSSGLGRTIEGRLRAASYDIRLLQPVHGELARFGSITGTLVTADQRLASDNITVEIVAGCFPLVWAEALNYGRISKVVVDDTPIETDTFATMGIGFTFPMQTLLFLGLLLAIRDHLRLADAVVSVFGDDLIYDVRMHNLVVDVFSRLGLVINEDKTFAEGHFRESCGYDYYHGFDVRPFHLGDGPESTSLKRRSIEAYLYKTINALRRRWPDEDIPLSVTCILESLKQIRESQDFLVVPHDYPDTSGLKLSRMEFDDFPGASLPRRDKHGTSRFRYLTFESKQLKEKRHAPYLWQALSSDLKRDHLAHRAVLRVKGSVHSHGTLSEASPPIFREEDEEDETGSKVTFRSKLSGRRLRQKLTTIAAQMVGRFKERPGVASSWAPESNKVHQVSVTLP